MDLILSLSTSFSNDLVLFQECFDSPTDPFGSVLGLGIGLAKSGIAGILSYLDPVVLSLYDSLCGCSILHSPVVYSGFPLGGNPNSSSLWDLVVEKITRRLDGWKDAYIFLRGTYPNLVLSFFLLSYCTSCRFSRFHELLLGKLRKSCRIFFGRVPRYRVMVTWLPGIGCARLRRRVVLVLVTWFLRTLP